MSTLAQSICVTTSASAIAFHCSFNNSDASMTTSGNSASRTQTYPRLPAHLTLYSRAPSLSRRSRMPRNVRRELGHMPATGFRAICSASLVHPRNAGVLLCAQDVTDIGQSFLHAVRAKPWLPQFSSLRERVLCVAKDETSVDIMCRNFCCNFLWKSRYDKSGLRDD
jgi:hypothetical protein